MIKVSISAYAEDNNLSYREIWERIQNGKLKYETTDNGDIIIITQEIESSAVKTCATCKLEKSTNDFVKDKCNKDGFTYDCKICRNKKVRDGIKNNPDYYKLRNEKNREYRKNYDSDERNKKRRRNIELIKVFGITLEEYEDLLMSQGGVCAICKEEQKSTRNKRLAVDHCHSTGEIRGLLCDNCNRALGLLKDSSHILNSAIKYLNKKLN